LSENGEGKWLGTKRTRESESKKEVWVTNSSGNNFNTETTTKNGQRTTVKKEIRYENNMGYLISTTTTIEDIQENRKIEEVVEKIVEEILTFECVERTVTIENGVQLNPPKVSRHWVDVWRVSRNLVRELLTVVPFTTAVIAAVVDYCCGWVGVKFLWNKFTTPTITDPTPTMLSEIFNIESWQHSAIPSRLWKAAAVLGSLVSVCGLWKLWTYFSKKDSINDSSEENQSSSTKPRERNRRKASQPDQSFCISTLLLIILGAVVAGTFAGMMCVYSKKPDDVRDSLAPAEVPEDLV